MGFRILACLILLAGSTGFLSPAAAQERRDGSRQLPLRVMLIPADGGTEDGTLADFRSLFHAITQTTGLQFDLRVGQSYGAVVEGMSNNLAEIAFLGPVTFLQAKARGGAELLAVAVEGGESVYYAGIFVSADSEIRDIQDLRGKRIAFGDINSTSSFIYPVSMLMEAGINPARDLETIRMTGNHANSIAALVQGQVDAACLAFDSFERAVRVGTIRAQDVRLLARSHPIPYPPLAVHSDLPESLKERLREAIHNVHTAPGIRPEMLRGYAQKQVDRYDARFSEKEFIEALRPATVVTDEIRTEILRKASAR